MLEPLERRSGYKRRRRQEEELTERNALLEQENAVLQLKISTLNKELDFLRDLTHDDNATNWAEEMINRSLTQQVMKYNSLRRQYFEVLKFAENMTKRNDMFHTAKVNALFILEKVPVFNALSEQIEPLVLKDETPLKFALYKVLLRMALQLYSIQTGCLKSELPSDDLVSWRPDLDVKYSQVDFRCLYVEHRQKWVSVKIKNYPISLSQMKKVFKKIDIFALIMMSSPAAKAHIAENKIRSEVFRHAVGYTTAILPVNFYGQTAQLEEFDLKVSRPCEDHCQDIAFISAADYESEDEYICSQSLLPYASTDLEFLESIGAFFSRSLSITPGETKNGSETCNISILIGLKKPSISSDGDPETLKLVQQFEKALISIGADTFMEPKMHSHEKMVPGFGALLKTMIFVYHNYYTHNGLF